MDPTQDRPHYVPNEQVAYLASEILRKCHKLVKRTHAGESEIALAMAVAINTIDKERAPGFWVAVKTYMDEL